MIGTAQKFAYIAYGMTIESDIQHFGFQPSTGTTGQADVIVKFEDLSTLWSEWASPDDQWVCKDNFVMFKMPGTAIYAMANGNEIMISPMEHADPVKIRLYLDGYCMAAILMQRKVLPLHGSAVAINGKAYAIVGRSGAGKSTLTRSLLDRGCSFLCDDVIPVRLDRANGEVTIFPSFPEQKLWQESLDSLGMKSDRYDPIYEKAPGGEPSQNRGKTTKFAVPVAQYTDSPMPLAGIFELVKSENGSASVLLLSNNEQLGVVTRHTFNRALAAELGMLEWHFRTSVELVNRTGITRLIRPVTSFSAGEVASTMLNYIEQERL